MADGTDLSVQGLALHKDLARKMLWSFLVSDVYGKKCQLSSCDYPIGSNQSVPKNDIIL